MRRRLPILRSPFTKFLALTLLVACGLAVWLGSRALSAQHHLDTAKSSLSKARLALLDRDVPTASSAVSSAATDTARARSLTHDPIWRAVARVPGAGRSLREVSTMAEAADDVVREVLPPSISAARLLADDRIRRPDGAVDVAVLEQATAPVQISAERIKAVRRNVDDLPHRYVLSRVTRAREQLADQLDELSDGIASARKALELAPALLGADRPRTYFVLVQQTSEARGTGGLPGGYAILRADRGRLRVLESGSNTDLHKGPIPVPPGVPDDYEAAYGGNGAFERWQNVNLSPDLPVVARVITARWRAQGGMPVDGVVALDAQALADVLRGSAPIDIAGRSIKASELPAYLGIEQYGGLDLSEKRERKDRLADVARTAADRVTRADRNGRVLRGLVQAVRSGHLRMASDDPKLTAGLAGAGVTGALPSGAAPVAYAVVVNAAGGKLDYYLDRQVEYVAGPCTGRSRPSTIAVSLRNRAPASGLPPYAAVHVVGGKEGLSTVNETLLTVFGTRGARLDVASLDGRPLTIGGPGTHLTYRTEAGLPSWTVQLSLPRSLTRRLVLQLVEPAVSGAARVPEQPLARPLVRRVSLERC
jgi:hypothetical protein